MSREDDRDVGVSAAGMALLGSLFGDDPDAPQPAVTKHFVVGPRRDQSTFTPVRSACGIDGLQAHAPNTSMSDSGVTCDACKTELAARHKREDKRAIARVRKAPISIQKIEREVRERLVAAGIAKVQNGWVIATANAIETKGAA